MIKIQNVYYMLAYTYSRLNEDEIKKYDKEKFDNIYDLFAVIITNLVNKQIKRGLNRDYQMVNDELTLIRGKIDITNTIRENSLQKNKIVCIYDEYLLNSYFNQIIKTTILFLLNSQKIVNSKRKQNLKKILQYLTSVTEIKDIKRIKWKSIRYNKNNESYRFLLQICELILKELYIGSNENNLLLSKYKEDRLMARLYEDFIRTYYIKNCKDFTVKRTKLEWNTIDKDKIPEMTTDISFVNKNEEIKHIIDAKFYCNIYSKFYEKEKFNSNNMYQIYSYVKNSKCKDTTGILLYAKTDEENIGWNEFVIDNHKFVITDLDLSNDFTVIEEKLDDILKWCKKTVTKEEMNLKYNEKR